MTFDQELFERNPRDYALQLVEDGIVTNAHLLLCCLKYMSHDDVRGALDANELSPRFDDDEDEEEECEWEFGDEEDVRQGFWEDHPEFEDEYDENKTQNDYNATIRTAFVDWLDQAHREGRLSDELAGETTLG